MEATINENIFFQGCSKKTPSLFIVLEVITNSLKKPAGICIDYERWTQQGIYQDHIGSLFPYTAKRKQFFPQCLCGKFLYRTFI